MEELKSCPFCGSEKVAVDYAVGEFWISCSKCMCATPLCRTEREAEYIWNQRVNDES